jgi:integrase/recombinase XerD
MEGIKKVFTTELEPYISELKEVMLKKGYSNCQIQTYSKIWNNMISYATNQPEQEFTENFRQKFLQDVYSESLERRDSMYRITRAINMFSDFTQFHVIFRQYCTSKSAFSEELKDIFLRFLE